MNLLGAKLYDPAGLVSKATSALLAMTAFDTTNLRLTFTVPAHGMVEVRICCVLKGAVTFPTILLGVMNGSTVVGRVAPIQSLGNTAVATALVNCEAKFVVTGLTPGSVSWDAAYGVEVIAAATNIVYGGPDNTTTNNAAGGFVFEVRDPQPFGVLATQSSVNAIAAKTVNLPPLPAAVGSEMALTQNSINQDSLSTDAIGLIAAGVLATALTEAYAADGAAPTLSQLLFLVQQTLTESSVTWPTQTIKKLDGSTTAATLTLASSGGTDSITRAT